MTFVVAQEVESSKQRNPFVANPFFFSFHLLHLAGQQEQDVGARAVAATAGSGGGGPYQ